MAIYDIEFKHVEIYYHNEAIEATSKEEAEAIARRLLDTDDFEYYLMDRSTYDDHEDSFIQARECKSEWASVTMTPDEVARYIS